tara:strand:- start:61 stop:765 length:705 start_codon:yes stop_codon:yes gene_type:complete
MIYCDDRENEALIHRLYLAAGDRRADPKGNVVVKRLNHGDYMVGKWLIEAKEINDLYRSILGIGRNGRTINHQLSEMCEVSEEPFLAVYGTQFKPFFKGRKPKSHEVAREIAKMNRVVKSFKMTLYSQFPKIRLVEFNSMDDFVEWLCVSHTKKRMAQALTPPKRTKSMPTDPRLLALMGIPGVTEAVATDLLNKFGGLPQMLRSKVRIRDLQQIRGVGRVLARRIKSLREPWD